MMGRRSDKIPAGTKVHLRRVPIDRQGYDEGGAYWGVGLPHLFVAYDDDGNEFYLRARDRNDAKAKLFHLTFYR